MRMVAAYVYQLEWAKNRFSKPGNIWGSGQSERGQREGTRKSRDGRLRVYRDKGMTS